MKIKVFIFAILFLTVGNISAYSYMAGKDFFADNIPQPRLIEPVTDILNIPSEGGVAFRWSPHEGDFSQRKYYDFRLYKGYQTVESGLIYKQNISPNQCRIEMPVDTFDPGQVYTWSLRQVYRLGKSRRSTSSFTAIK